MSDPNKQRRYYIDWWNIKKSTVYGAITIVLLLGAIIGGGWWLYRNEFFLSKTNDVMDIPKDSARIISFEGDVRVTRAATRETIIVTKATYVSAGDTVQTQADGRAQIQMIDGSVLTIRPNSTVIIRDSSSIFGGKNVRVALDAGQLNVRTEDQPADTDNVVEVKESENKLLSQTDASFGINPNTNGGEIRVSRGGVETNVGGDKTLVQNGEFASINNGKTSKENLLLPPKLTAPNAQNPVQALAGGAADVTFSWEKPAVSIQSYHLQVSRSPFFVPDTIVFERTALTQTSFTVANLAPGTLLLADSRHRQFGTDERMERKGSLYDYQRSGEPGNRRYGLESRESRRKDISNQRQNAVRRDGPRGGTRNFRDRRRLFSTANRRARVGSFGRNQR